MCVNLPSLPSSVRECVEAHFWSSEINYSYCILSELIYTLVDRITTKLKTEITTKIDSYESVNKTVNH